MSDLSTKDRGRTLLNRHNLDRRENLRSVGQRVQHLVCLGIFEKFDDDLLVIQIHSSSGLRVLRTITTRFPDCRTAVFRTKKNDTFLNGSDAWTVMPIRISRSADGFAAIESLDCKPRHDHR